MKLKRLFLDNSIKKTVVFFAAVFSFLFISCSSNKIAFPIPGENASAITNIYIEYLNIADIYFSLEKFDKAESYYKAAMGNKDIYWNAYYKLAKCYAYQSKWGDAQTSYETILKRDPDNSSIKSSIAYIYAMNGNTTKAIDMYTDLIANAPEQAELYENYICVLLAAEKKEEAKEQYEVLKEKFPESKRLEELGKHFEETEETEESEENTASEKEPAVPVLQQAQQPQVEGEQTDSSSSPEIFYTSPHQL